MWPFTRKKDTTIDAAVSQAIKLAASEWQAFCATSGMASNINLRDRVPFFAGDFRRKMIERLPMLKFAPEQLVLLIIAEGIDQSGLETRSMIELQLGIVLPGSAAIAAMAERPE